MSDISDATHVIALQSIEVALGTPPIQHRIDYFAELIAEATKQFSVSIAGRNNAIVTRRFIGR